MSQYILKLYWYSQIRKNVSQLFHWLTCKANDTVSEYYSHSSETNQFHIIFQNCRKTEAINIWTNTMITYNSNSIIRKMACSKWMIMKLITSDFCDLFSGHFKQTSLLLFALRCSQLFRQESKNIVYKLFIHSVILFLQKYKQMTLCIYIIWIYTYCTHFTYDS